MSAFSDFGVPGLILCRPIDAYFETKKILTKLFEENGLKVRDLGYETAFNATIGEGYPHIGLIAELDALPTLGHPFASKKDNAAYSCGHSTQCTIMASVLLALKETIKKGTVTLYFTPRKSLRISTTAESSLWKRRSVISAARSTCLPAAALMRRTC